MPLLSDDYADRIQDVFGQRPADAVRRRSDTARDYLADKGARFQIQGNSAEITVSDDDPVIDYGGRTRNEANLATPLMDIAASPVAEAVSDAVGYTITDDNSRGTPKTTITLRLCPET